MTTVNHFSYGWVTLAVSLALSVTGCLLGIMLAWKARRRTGSDRTRLLLYATIAFGGIGIWQSQVIALLGVQVPDAVVRYDPLMLGLSLVVALVDVGTALFLVARVRVRARALIPAGLIIGLGAATTSYTTLKGLRVSATVAYDPVRFGVTVALCVLLAPFALASIAALRGLFASVVASVLLGLIVSGIQYGGQWAMIVYYRQSMSDIDGISSATLISPMILSGCTMVVMLAYFTVGGSTRWELRSIYSRADEPEPIEPWLIEEVTARVVNGTTITPLSTYLEQSARRDAGRRISRPRPTPGIRPTWHRMPVWGSPIGVVDQSRIARNDAERLRAWPVSHPRPEEPQAPVARPEPPVVIDAEPVMVGAGAPLPRRTVVDHARSAAENVDLDASVLSLAGVHVAEQSPSEATPATATATAVTQATAEAGGTVAPATAVTPATETGQRWRNRRRP